MEKVPLEAQVVVLMFNVKNYHIPYLSCTPDVGTRYAINEGL